MIVDKFQFFLDNVKASNENNAAAIYEKINSLPEGSAELKLTNRFGKFLTNYTSKLSKKSLFRIICGLAFIQIIQLALLASLFTNLNSCNQSLDDIEPPRNNSNRIDQDAGQKTVNETNQFTNGSHDIQEELSQDITELNVDGLFYQVQV